MVEATGWPYLWEPLFIYFNIVASSEKTIISQVSIGTYQLQLHISVKCRLVHKYVNTIENIEFFTSKATEISMGKCTADFEFTKFWPLAEIDKIKKQTTMPRTIYTTMWFEA